MIIKVARVYKGKCQICLQPIIKGQAYTQTGKTITQNQYLVHYNCYKPTNAPTYEELSVLDQDYFRSLK